MNLLNKEKYTQAITVFKSIDQSTSSYNNAQNEIKIINQELDSHKNYNKGLRLLIEKNILKLLRYLETLVNRQVDTMMLKI